MVRGGGVVSAGFALGSWFFGALAVAGVVSVVGCSGDSGESTAATVSATASDPTGDPGTSTNPSTTTTGTSAGPTTGPGTTEPTTVTTDPGTDTEPTGQVDPDLCDTLTITSPAPGNEVAQTAASCTGCDDAGVVTITVTLDQEYPCGRFADGSPWVHDGGGGVTIVDIDPPITDDCGAEVCNGWMINPSTNTQAFDGRRDFDGALVPEPSNPTSDAPFVAQGGTSIVKSVSFQDEIVGDGCDDQDVFGQGVRNCLYYYGVITVLDELPGDGTGEGYLRPPFVGSDKPLIAVSEIDAGLLPSLPTAPVTDDLPNLERAEDTLCTVAVDHMGTYIGQFFKGYLNSGETPSSYQGYVSRKVGDYLLRALHEDRSERMIHCVVQRGVDLFHMLRDPVGVSWNPNGGHGEGRTAWPYLAAALLGRDDWAAEMDAMSRGRFAERSQVYWSPVADPNGDRGGPGEVLYGAYAARRG